MSLRLRVALLTAVAVVIIEVATIAAVYLFVSQRLHAQVEDELRSTATSLVPIVTSTGDLPRPGQDPQAVPHFRRAIAGDGRTISTRGTLDLPVTEAARRVARGEVASSVETVRAGGDSFAVVTLPAGGDRAVQAARSIAATEDLLRQLLAWGIVLGLAGALAAVAAGAAVATGARLERLVAELERARSAQRQFIADASHELRKPLTALRANVELLGIDAGGAARDREHLLADTRAGVDDVAALVTQLVDLAREDERVLRPAAVRLDQVVREAVDRVQRRYPDVEFRVEDEPTSVMGDAEALARAADNLLDNAGKWTPAGRAVHVTVRRGVLEVRDEGPGVDAADVPRIFERFYRGSRAGALPGSGLGLAIVARVVEAHGGEVSVTQAVDGGAIFRARFATAPS